MTVELSLRTEDEGAVPVVGRRVLLISPNAPFVEVVEQFQRLRLVGLAAALDRGQRAIPVAAAVAGQHLDGEIAQPRKRAECMTSSRPAMA